MARRPKPTIMNAARSLLETGVRRICISLKGSQQNPEREIAFKKIIDQQYPDHFLGSVPVLAGSEISQEPRRSHAHLLRAHQCLYARRARRDFIQSRGRSPRTHRNIPETFLVSHINGGVAGIAKTKAIDTIESGPILGILGSAHLAKSYGLNDVVAMDVGGTTAKISVLRNGEPIYRKPSDLFGNPIGAFAPISAFDRSRWRKRREAASRRSTRPRSTRTRKHGLVSRTRLLRPRRRSGHAHRCVRRRGLINPEYFLGGSKPIDLELARKTIEELVAQPLHLSFDDACKIIIDHAFTAVAHMIAGAQQRIGRGLCRTRFSLTAGMAGCLAPESRQAPGSSVSSYFARPGLQRVRLVRFGYLPRVRASALRSRR